MFPVDAMRSSRLFSQAVSESLVPEYQLFVCWHFWFMSRDRPVSFRMVFLIYLD